MIIYIRKLLHVTVRAWGWWVDKMIENYNYIQHYINSVLYKYAVIYKMTRA